MSNIDKPAIAVYWSNLRWVGSGLFRRECPFCKNGRLLVGRDQETYTIEAHDRCIGCGQLVEYLDVEDMRKIG